MNKVLLFPGYLKNNSYMCRLKEDLKISYDVAVEYFSINRFLSSGFRSNILVVSWLENQARNYGIFGFFIVFSFLVISYILRYKVVYIIHNRFAHDVRSDFIAFWVKASVFVIKKMSYRVVSHGVEFSKINCVEYVPHPLYKLSEDISEISLELPDTYFLIFGRMKPYKKLYQFLENVNPKLPVVIAGRFDSEYFLQCQALATKRKLNVFFLDNYIEPAKLDYLILNSVAVIVTNDSDSSIISGSVMHAISLGKSALCGSEALINEFPNELISMGLIRHEALGEISKTDNYSIQDQSFVLLSKLFSEDAVGSILKGMMR